MSVKKCFLWLVVFSVMLSNVFAEMVISGSAELDLFYRTKQIQSPENNGFRGKFNEEIAIVVNVDGYHDTGNDYLTQLRWRLAQKVATDGRNDPWGVREAWAGGKSVFGEIRFGNQFSNIYLLQDWPYGTAGVNNLWADFGSHEAQYSRAISYLSPIFAGFSFSTQYDLGDTKPLNHDSNLLTPDKLITSYATEVVLTYDSKYMKIDTGYYRGVNVTMDAEPDVFGGKKGAFGSSYSAAENLAELYYLGSILKYEDMSLQLAYSMNKWKGNVGGKIGITNSGDSVRVDKLLVKGIYRFLPKHRVSLGYVRIFDAKVDISDNKTTVVNGINAVDSQYDYFFTDTISFFLQTRYEVLRGKDASVMAGLYQLNGKHMNSDNVARILIGFYTTF